jgi:hypothetical protein
MLTSSVKPIEVDPTKPGVYDILEGKDEMN